MKGEKNGKRGERREKEIDKAQRLLRSSEARKMRNDCEKAKFLKENKIGPVPSAEALKTSINNVKRWRKDSTKVLGKGRPNYLTALENDLLVAAVLSADSHHEGLTAKQVQQKVFFRFSTKKFRVVVLLLVQLLLFFVCFLFLFFLLLFLLLVTPPCNHLICI